MLLVGLTGGLGSGKTTVARMLEARGAVVVDADLLAREAIDPGTPGFERVVETFGAAVVREDGRIDRDALASAAFGNEDKRRALEAIIHPEVFRRLAETALAHRDSDTIVVFDAALIVETGFHDAVDVLVVVAAPVEDQIERVTRERGMSEEEARRRIAAQVASEDREQAADEVIQNEGDRAHLEEQVDGLWARLQSGNPGKS
ncbi:MAG: dephospho-CoA kinase [Actinomycetota bacterium]